MNPIRIMLLSGARPSRAWRIAERISNEMPGAEVCGIVQHSWQQLPWMQTLIATGNFGGIGCQGRLFSQAGVWIRKLLEEVVHWGIWFAHGCPRGVRANVKFTDKDLATRCYQRRWPFLRADNLGGRDVAKFARQQNADLIIVLGQLLPSSELFDVPSLGLVRTMVRGGSDPSLAVLQEGTELKVEYFARGSKSACNLATVSLPPQAYDSLQGIMLKRDLIADDLLVQTARGLEEGSPARASKELKEWIQRILAPCLDQFGPPPVQPSAIKASFHQRHRSVARLLAQSLLGFLWVLGRNWYRRLRGRYPVLILTHHLVSDRPHRMGIPTEDFLRQVRFLQRHYRIVSLSEADRLLRSGRVSAPTVVLTFDDGYADNFITLRAVAEETGITVAMFVATQPIEAHQEFAHDLAAATRGFFPLTWDQIQNWRGRGVEFGSHTRTHADCGTGDRTLLEPEIIGSRKDFEGRCGCSASFFAFPFGKPENISAQAMHMAAATYSIFLSAFGGENLPCKDDRLQHLFRKSFYSHPWELELDMQSVFDMIQNSKLRINRSLRSWRSAPVTAKS